MGNEILEKKGEKTRREKEADLTLERLRKHGRAMRFKLWNGSVRTCVWNNREDSKVPALVEQVRLYATWKDTGTTRGMEASDLVHVYMAIEDVRTHTKRWPGVSRPPLEISDREFENALRRDGNPPWKTVRVGNVAALIWENKTKCNDAVYKVEFFEVFPAIGAERFVCLGSLPNFQQCCLDADDEIKKSFQEYRRR